MPRPAREPADPRSEPYGLRVITPADLEDLTSRAGLASEQRLQVRAVAAVLGFRTTGYVIDELIDWADAPDDPIYRLVVPHEDMLPAADLTPVTELLRQDAPRQRIDAAVRHLRTKLAADHDAHLGPQILPGMHRTDHDTVLIFPARQSTGDFGSATGLNGAPSISESNRPMATGDVHRLTDYLAAHPEVTAVRLTGTEPLVMGAPALRRVIEPLLAQNQLESIQIDTATLTCWPHRFITDPDADDTLRLFEQITRSGKGLTLAAVFCHPRELHPAPVTQAVHRIGGTGAAIHTQGMLIGSVNDTAEEWEALWRTQTRMGMIPKSMTINRHTADRLTVPLARAHEIFTSAYARIAGLGRTVRGPAMNTTYGTVCVDGTADIGTQKVFVLRFTHAGDPNLIGEPFFATFDPTATWLTDLKPAFASRFPHQSDA